MSYQIPPGMFDILPVDQAEPWRASHLWHWAEEKIRDVCETYCYYEMRTPILERTELFQKGTGDTTDIVTKEMYTFEDRGGRSLTLRPEGTPPVLRAYVEKQLHNKGWPQKFFYLAPMFRYERQQAGRYRQHHQFGVEAVGSDAPEQDAEIIDLLLTTYRSLGLKNLNLIINSLGDEQSRTAFREALVAYLTPYKNDLSEDSQRRLEANPLRVLDSKAKEDQEIIAGAPTIVDHLTDDCRKHFAQVQACLDVLEIEYTVTPRLVRGLDYYTKTVFEVTADVLGAQNSIGGGGRYDGLIKTLGGPDLPAIGFGSGLERILQTLIKQRAPQPGMPQPKLFIAALGQRARDAAFSYCHQFRERGVSTHMDFSTRKIGKVMQKANASGAELAVVLGDKELDKGIVKVKTMSTGQELEVQLDEMVDILTRFAAASNPLTAGAEAYRAQLQDAFTGVFSALGTDAMQQILDTKEDDDLPDDDGSKLEQN